MTSPGETRITYEAFGSSWKGWSPVYMPRCSVNLLSAISYKRRALSFNDAVNMLFSWALPILALPALALAQDTCLQTVKKTFDDACIPANLSLVFNPQVLFEVSLPEKDNKYITLRAGVQVPINLTAGPPIFNVIGDSRNNGPFVVLLIDPDAFVPPTNVPVRQFFGTNFFRNSSTSPFLLVNTTPAITEYLQPEPPAGSKPHRYIFLLFDQPNDFNHQTLVNSSTPIFPFNLSQFVNDTGLRNPIGGTFMRVGPANSSSSTQ